MATRSLIGIIVWVFILSFTARAQYPRPLRADSTLRLLFLRPLPPLNPLNPLNPLTPLTPQHWGIFCRLESALEQRTRIPLRVRMGSLEQVNYLEGK